MTLPTTRRRRARLVGLAALALACSCGFDPRPAPRAYTLSENTLEALEGYPDVQGQLLGALGMLVGTPDAPRWMVTSEWADEGWNPNYPWYEAGDDGSGEIGEARREEIRAANRERFADAIAAIEEGRYDEVVLPARARSLVEGWEADLEAFRAGEFEDEASFREEAIARLEDYYPSLADSAELYRQQCQHCHGVNGGGDGPTAPYLDPHPRDYRRGIFKWTSVADKWRPRRADLYRTIHDGVYMTAMPSFARFTPAEIEGLVDYVRLLSIRGEVEILLTLEFQNETPLTPDLVIDTYRDVWEKWLTADEHLITYDGEIPPPTPERIALGREVFMDAKKGNCFSCHGERGLGDGVASFEVDENGNRVRVKDDWGYPAVPRNLRQGLFRGGKRPIDLYRRVYAGINGTPMPAGNGVMTPDEMWAVVHYVRSLSERPDGRGLEPWVEVASDSDAHSTGHGGAHEGAAGH